MKIKKILPVICAVTIMGTMGVTAFATTDIPSNSVTTSSAISINNEVRNLKANWTSLTDEEKAEIKQTYGIRKAEKCDMQEKWSALTDEQKEEIYALKDEQVNIKSEMVDKYLEFGVIDQDTANDMKTRITESKSNIRENIKMSINEGFGKEGKRANWKSITNEEKAKIKEEHGERKAGKYDMQEKWSALTDEQKEEIYALKDEQVNIKSEMVDKYLEFGVIDEDTASDMKTRITENKSNMRENDKMSITKRFGKEGKGFKCNAPMDTVTPEVE